MIGYWGSWSTYRRGKAKFTASDIDPRSFTHLIYSFVNVDSRGNVRTSEGNLIESFMQLKQRNSSVKLMFSIGGANVDSATFSMLASSDSSRGRFARNVVAFANLYGFDGFDLDWEFPGSDDKSNFVRLLRELSNVLRPAGMLLTIAVGATQWRIDEGYDVRSFINYVDFINLMTYDLHGVWDRKTGLNSPLRRSSFDNTPFNVEECVNAWTSSGCPAYKLIMGIATYGRSFTLKSSSTHIGAPVNGVGNQGRYIQESGFLPYYEICENIKYHGWTRKYDHVQKAPYAIKGNQWVGYDDEESVGEKARFINNKGLGGAMFWSVDTDDFMNANGNGQNPLITTVYNILLENTYQSSRNFFVFLLFSNAFSTICPHKVKL
jgi:chitinase